MRGFVRGCLWWEWDPGQQRCSNSISCLPVVSRTLFNKLASAKSQIRRGLTLKRRLGISIACRTGRECSGSDPKVICRHSGRVMRCQARGKWFLPFWVRKIKPTILPPNQWLYEPAASAGSSLRPPAAFSHANSRNICHQPPNAWPDPGLGVGNALAVHQTTSGRSLVSPAPQ
jgi:hypothetical protein